MLQNAFDGMKRDLTLPVNLTESRKGSVLGILIKLIKMERSIHSDFLVIMFSMSNCYLSRVSHHFNSTS
ncbi:CLUMA_CG008097, isoform A [Clunio marinus]|uniref:CLUMA_CG008097, isoform A n=1 Tax=Clunio marinus TaxID=568069 RepID=A0A1J1I2T7_9DIPT|nr:CLUMA_CG008097, isoform A [Clunio marinus]